jgi:FAD/FMN-containing dehydrogenase
VLDELRAIVGDAHVLVDDDVRAGYEVDWTGRFRGSTPAVVRPATVDEVAAVVRVCGASGTAIVPQGGNTGLVGGGVPLRDEIVLSLRRLRDVGSVDVLGDGSVVRHLGGLTKDNTGYDLAGLLCGSEGTLGIVTAARLRLVPPVASPITAVLALPGAGAAVDIVVAMRSRVTLEAAEVWLDPPAPVADAPAYLLLEWDGDVDALAGVDAVDIAVAEDSQRRAELWRYREQITESINRIGIPHKLDVTLPLGEIAAFCDEVRAVVPHRVFLFGHVGDGNIHVNIVGPDPDDDSVDGQVLELVAARGGSISAEHGIGTAKKQWLHLNRSVEEIAAFAAIKRALDPHGILNPNVLL